MATWTVFNDFSRALAEGLHDFGADAFKIAIASVDPSAQTLYSGITEIAGTGGYTTGGETVTITTPSQSAGTTTITCSESSITWTANASSPTNARYFVLYNVTGGGLIAYIDNGTPIDMTANDIVLSLTSSELLDIG